MKWFNAILIILLGFGVGWFGTESYEKSNVIVSQTKTIDSMKHILTNRPDYISRDSMEIIIANLEIDWAKMYGHFGLEWYRAQNRVEEMSRENYFLRREIRVLLGQE